MIDRVRPPAGSLPFASLSALPAAVFVLDGRGRVAFANRRLHQATGMPHVVGRRPVFLRSCTEKAQRAEVARDVADGRDWSGRVTVGERQFEVTAVRLPPDPAGAGPALLCVALDVTRESDLEHRLQRAQRLEALGQLASGMVHDINNILTIIETTATFAQRRAGPDSVLGEDLREIREAVRSAAQLSRQILSFSRRGAEGSSPVDVNAFVRKAAHMLRRLVGDSIALETELGRDVPHLTADESQLEQVLTNLVVNARDAMPPTGGRIRISTTVRDVARAEIPEAFPRAEPGRHVSITVRDNGLGMDEETLQRVFEPFFTTKGPEKGTGLGLATVHALVEQHRGFLTVSSARGIGTEFVLHLPATGPVAAVPGPFSATSATPRAL